MQAAVSWSSPEGRRYVVRTTLFMGAYALLMIAIMAGALERATSAGGGWVLAAAASAPILGQIWATLSLMNEADEFVRAVVAKQFIAAAGLAFAVATLWGFGETFAGAPHLPTWMVYPLFWACFGVTAPFIRTSR